MHGYDREDADRVVTHALHAGLYATDDTRAADISV
jgi:hypothetical protein